MQNPTQFILILLIGVMSVSCKRVEPLKDNVTTDPIAMEDSTKGKVTGIGGVFFKCQDPEKMKDWYSSQLGMVTDQYGALFEFRKSDNPDQKAYLQWSPFSEKTEYFLPSEKPFMINYRVKNIENLVDQLRKSGVTIVDSIESFEYGKFVHIMDPEGNKIELWEPVDSVFTQSHEGKTTK